MREPSRRIYSIRPRSALSRGADGRLKPAADTDLSDVWAEQKRIRLREAIEEDKRKAAKKAKRAERRKHFFKKKQPAAPIVDKQAGAGDRLKARKTQGSAGAGTTTGATAKAIEINISMPSLPRLPKVSWARVKKQLKRLPRKAWVGIGIFLFLSVGVYAIPLFTGGFHLRWPHHSAAKPKVSVGSQSTNGPVKATPTFATITPAGKSMTNWSKISPPGRDPVYAYADQINGVRVDVSEQPLPASFKTNTADQIASMAQGFNATQKMTLSSTTVYIGTSANGPQSLIFTEKGLLILIRSTSRVSADQWAGYISKLQ
ncbi:MAG TPA: hypothetical protein VLH84_01465 [Patescibacteria group bacterium]|nr:hypothetical protein [Patescibacteria group bacterium]